MSQQIVFELSVSDANVTLQLEKLRAELKQINKELKAAEPGSDAFNKLAVEAQATKQAIGELTLAQKALKREFAAAQVPTDSLAGLRLEYGKLIEQVTRLSKAERESKVGQDLIRNAAGVKDEINAIQESVGNFTGSVGNYKGGILAAFDVLQKFGGSLGDQAGLLATAKTGFDLASQGAESFAGAVGAGFEKLKAGVSSAREYIANLRETKKVQKEAAEAASETGEAVGEAAVEGIQAGAALEESAKGASLFSRAGTALKGVLSGLGIGIVITLVTSLVAAFQRFAPIIDFVEQAVAGLSAAFDVLVARSTQLFLGFSKFFSGDFAGGFDQITGSVSGLGSAMTDAALSAADLQKQMQDLDDQQKDFVLQNAKAEASVAKLNIALKDRTKTDAERLKIAADISRIESANLSTKTGLIDKEIEIEKRRLQLTGQLSQQEIDQIASGNFDVARLAEDQFRLKQDQTDKIRDLLVKRVNAEGESAALLERVENRKNAILDAAAQKREQNAKKAQDAIEKENKALEAQTQRVLDLSKAIRDLDASTILNEFDRKETEIENKRSDALEKLQKQRDELNKRGIKTALDKQEADLISEETASIKAAFDEQLKAVSDARNKAREEQLSDLRELGAEVQRQISENAGAALDLELQAINSNFAAQRAELERQRADKLISEEAFAAALIQLEIDRAKTVKLTVADITKAKIDAARLTLNAELSAIQETLKAEIDAAREREKTQGIESTQEVELAKQKAYEQTNKARLDFAASEADAVAAGQQSELDGIRAVDAAKEQAAAADDKRIQDELDKRKRLGDFLIEQAQTIASAVFDIEKNRLAEQTTAATEALDAETQKRKDQAQGNAVKLAQIDKDYQKKKAEIEKQAAKERQQIALKEAIIGGALAVVKALPNAFAAIAAAIAAAAQIAIIANQKFARGGVAKVGQFGGRPHSQGGTKGRFDDGTNIEVEKDEVFVILNRRASKEYKMLSDLNYRNGGAKFATGGVLDFTPQLALPGSSGGAQQITVVSQAVFSDEQIAIFAAQVATETATKTQQAVGIGLDDANRNRERQTRLAETRAV